MHLYEILIKFWIPNKLVTLIKMMLKNSNGKVKIQGKLTEVFNTERVLRQGDALSIILFNILLEELIWNIESKPTVTVFNILTTT
jgi:hypothetical protein